MKNNSKIFLLCSFITFNLASCDIDTDDNRTNIETVTMTGPGIDVAKLYCKSYVPRYVFPDSISGEQTKREYQCLDLKFWGDNYCIDSNWKISQFDGKKIYNYTNREIFGTLSNRYKDNAYNGHTWINLRPSLAYPLTSASIVSDSDYDNNHPAGTELTDIIQFNTASYFPFISNGYKLFEEGGDCYLTTKLFSDLTQTERSMWPSEVGLVFPQEPTLSEEHNLTIKFSFEEGKDVTTKQTIKF